MGQYVRDTVMQFYRENDLGKLGISYIEINLSIIEGFQHNIVDSILNGLRKYDLQTDCINLEITETAVSTMPETLEYNLAQLSGQGISFSLDDYGTGYSNMVRILDFPCSIVKLDKSLIWYALQSDSAEKLLAGTFRMLKDVNKKVLAEGVETREQAERLIEMGCDYIQGYYYAKPMSGKDFLALFETGSNTLVSD